MGGEGQNGEGPLWGSECLSCCKYTLFYVWCVKIYGFVFPNLFSCHFITLQQIQRSLHMIHGVRRNGIISVSTSGKIFVLTKLVFPARPCLKFQSLGHNKLDVPSIQAVQSHRHTDHSKILMVRQDYIPRMIHKETSSYTIQ
jgi:hypothetical protein